MTRSALWDNARDAWRMATQRRTIGARRLAPDPWLVGAVAALAAIGAVMVYNASYFYAQNLYRDPLFFARRHFIYLAFGIVTAWVTVRTPGIFWERWARVIFFLSVASLVAVLVAGTKEGGAQRWVALKPLHVTVQPAEFLKTTLVLYLARYIARRGDRLHLWWGGLLPPLFVAAIPLALIYVQPDYGTLVILSLTMGAMLVAAGTTRAQVSTLVLGGAVLLGLGAVAEPYRLRRILTMFSTWEHARDDGYQVVQSMIAIGSGGMWGVGLGGSQQKLFFLPAAHTDFILAVIGEEKGFVGIALILGLFMILIWRGFRIALAYDDLFARFVAFGLTMSFVLEVGANAAVVLGMAPPKGLVLPFVGYGGSALVGAFWRAGILLQLSRSAIP